MNRRAQLVQNIIIFVVGLVVIGLVLLFGYSVYDGLQEDRCEVRALQFATDLSTALDRNKDWGMNTVVNLQAPCETDQVCFVDRRVIDNPPAHPDYLDQISSQAVQTRINTSVWTNVIEEDGSQDVIETGQQTNVFTIGLDGRTSGVDSYSTAAAPIRVEDNSNAPSATCIDVDGQTLRVRMTGDGRTAEITPGGD